MLSFSVTLWADAVSRPAVATLFGVAAFAIFNGPFLSPQAVGQEPLSPIVLEGEQPLIDPFSGRGLTDSERDRLYAEIAIEADELERRTRLLRKVTALVTPTVVHIDTKKPGSNDSSGEASEDESGSGVVTTVAGQTVVLTNRHVIHGAGLDDIRIRMDDGREYRPTRVWTDPATDIGVMAVAGERLQTARVATEGQLQIGDTVRHEVGEGDGPVNALDAAVRKALEPHYPVLEKMHLLDYKVRVINGQKGTAARVRVLIESTDGEENWGTVGVSENVIEASWLALSDAFEAFLTRHA